MFVEMTCKCEASFQADSDNNELLVMVWANSFVNAHKECGYMTKGVEDAEEKMKRYDVIYKELREKEL
jgi:hypothetical protein